jgi:hypothetical protein
MRVIPCLMAYPEFCLYSLVRQPCWHKATGTCFAHYHTGAVAELLLYSGELPQYRRVQYNTYAFRAFIAGAFHARLPCDSDLSRLSETQSVCRVPSLVYGHRYGSYTPCRAASPQASSNRIQWDREKNSAAGSRALPRSSACVRQLSVSRCLQRFHFRSSP